MKMVVMGGLQHIKGQREIKVSDNVVFVLGHGEPGRQCLASNMIREPQKKTGGDLVLEKMDLH